MKPINMDNTSDSINYATFAEEHKEELLKSAVAAIQPDVMQMDREQALTLAGAMKNCGFSREDFADVMSRSAQDKGTFAKQWGKFRGSGKHGTAGEGTIFDYAKKSGWKWPAPDPEEVKKKTPAPVVPKKLELLSDFNDDFRLVCILDDVKYKKKPVQGEAMAIRSREKVPTPAPQPMTIQDFAKAVTDGQTFSPAVYSKEQNGEDANGKPKYQYRAICQQIFIVDIDNEEGFVGEDGKYHKRRIDKPLSIDEAMEICKKNDIAPFFVYETFSSKEHREDTEAPYTKFRLCFATDKPLSVQEYGERGISEVISYFIGLFGKAADSKTTDTARLIYGTDEKDRAKLYQQIINSQKLTEKVFTKPQQEQQEQPEGIRIQTASDYLTSGTFDEDILYFKKFKNRKTGFYNIDEHLTLYPGLAVLGGASSLGKTTFAVNLMENLIDRGESVLFFTLEQLPIEIISKSLARALYRKDPATTLTNTDIKNGATNSTLEEVKKEYAQRSGGLYLITGDFRTTADEIREQVEQWIADTGIKPIVIIDYLQLIAPPEGKSTEIRLAIDENLKALKEMQRDNALFVLIISSFNRSESLEPVSYEAFKESGMIEFTCDYVWGLQYDIQRADNDDFYLTNATKGKRQTTKQERRKMLEPEQKNIPRRIQFVSLKSRNGKQRYNAEFLYYPQFDVYEERPGADNYCLTRKTTETADVFANLRNTKAK